MKPSGSTSIIYDMLKDYNMNFNNNGKSLCLAYEHQDDIAVIRKFGINGISMISFRKDNFTERIFTLMIVHWKKAMSLMEFYWMRQCLLVANSEYVIRGDFNYHLSKVSSNQLPEDMIGYTKVVNWPKHTPRS